MAKVLTTLCGRCMVGFIIFIQLCVGTAFGNLLLPSRLKEASLSKSGNYPAATQALLTSCVSASSESLPDLQHPHLLPNHSCAHTFTAIKANFGPRLSNNLVAHFLLVVPLDGCDRFPEVSAVDSSSYPCIAIISRGNCSFHTKVVNAEKAGFYAAIVYGHPEDTSLVVMEASATSSSVSIPAYFVNYTSGVILASLQANSSRSHFLTVLSHTTAQTAGTGQNNEASVKGSAKDDGEEDDSFGEHYFHICIYIWACVVVSSLIALSVKWGCCGRSLTRWEVKRIPLKRFQRVEGDDFQEKCPICHEEFHEGRLIRQLPCNHCYHSYCVDRWLVKMSNRCPLCKQRVSISLFCPWNKQRHKKEIHGHISDADAEASVDESPPLPPLATLTPSSWYGEAIMSGPSKFIIMRPGRPTRVIDVREQNMKSQSSAKEEDIQEHRDCDTRCQSVAESHQRTQNFDEIIEEHLDYNAHSCDIISTGRSANETTTAVSAGETDDGDDIITSDLPLPSVCSSRSCSVSSDQPLLLENQTDILDDAESNYSSEAQHCCLDLQPSKCSDDSHEETTVGGHSGDECLSKTEGRLDDDIHSNTAEATVTLSSGSSSVVSCNFKTLNTAPKLSNPSTPMNHFITHGTVVSSAPLSNHSKRHTLPEYVREAWKPDVFSTQRKSDARSSERSRKSASFNRKANYS